MLTLLMFGTFVMASCAAAAGLIASTQNSADAAKAMAGLDAHPDTGA